MRHYEMMVILSDLLEEEDATALFDRIKSILADQGGELVDESFWGKRKLTHEIHKRDHAWYGVLDFRATSEGVAELERQLKINDDVWRMKTVRPELRVHTA
ncbi:30S ribosomal protein S6 [Salsipaludibacter albus]|uniref:30S ribosomal protein S6 n=1 Tax=Salsipaludibacter albus TaxID=2849650 RepID=UPI001EE48812|nr:30S ribosomal protein S6 [Salsipaludibacter albus]MBY5163098.1 30S ribosomal protein S6 [Salsipaludibacter albus]